MRAASPTAHASLEVAWVDHGRASFRVGSRTTTVSPGAAMVVRWDVEHSTGFEGPSTGHALGLQRSFVSDVAGRIGSDANIVAAELDPSPDLVALCRMLARECRDAASGHVVATRGLAEAVVVELLRRHADDGSAAPADRRIAAARDRIHAEFAGALSVADLAQGVGLSRYHFSRLFRRETGRSPQAYVTHVRICEAARRLSEPGARVTTIAYDVGFSDPSRFTRCFKAAYGVTPSRYGATR